MPSEEGMLSLLQSQCSPSLLEPDYFQGGWLTADGEDFVLFRPSPGLRWAKHEVMGAGTRDSGCWDCASWLEQFLAFVCSF